MIDTIVLRLNNIKKYERSIKLFEMKAKNVTSHETGHVQQSEIDRLKKYHKDPTKIIKMLKINRTGDFLVQSERGKKKNSSGNYEFSFVTNWNQEYMEMNFSIPKFVYGMNVLMYIEHSRDRDYKFYENNLLEYNIKKAPTLLIAFLKQFINRQFIDEIDLEDVEITRIDVCWNQVFNSRADALYYLDYQKKIRKKHSREEGGLPIDYGTSLMHTTKRYSSKIYHKGSEYKKNDLKQHIKFNAEKGYQYFNTEKIAELAERTLRYEITIRAADLNYLFKHNIFRANCNFFKADYKRYLKISATKQRNDRISKKIGILPKDEKEMYRLLNPYEKITKDDREFYKHFSNLMERSPKFMLKENSFSRLYNSKTVILANSNENINCETALFSKELIALCLNKLIVFINEFQLKELPDIEIISLKIDRYNNLTRIKLPKPEMLKFYDLLLRSGSFKEAARIGRYSKATLYRFIDRFKKIGITENNIKPEENFDFPKAAIDLKEYHHFLSYQCDLVKNKRVIYDIFGV